MNSDPINSKSKRCSCDFFHSSNCETILTNRRNQLKKWSRATTSFKLRHENSSPSSRIVFDSSRKKKFHEYAKSLAYIGTMRIAGRREGGGEGRRRGCTLITSAKMVGRGDVYEAVASNYALTAAVKASRLPTAILRNSCFRDVIG